MAYEELPSFELRGKERLAIFRWNPRNHQPSAPVTYKVRPEEALAALAQFVATGTIPDEWDTATYWGPYQKPLRGEREVLPDRLALSRAGELTMSGVTSVEEVTRILSSSGLLSERFAQRSSPI